MEKAGTATFYASESNGKARKLVINSDYLTPVQEKMMATQPDMILQYAHYLEEELIEEGYDDPVVTVEAYVSLNGRRSRPFVDSKIDLTKEKVSWRHKDWVLAYE